MRKTLYTLLCILVGVLVGMLSFKCPGFPRGGAWFFTILIPLLMISQVPRKSRRYL